MAGARTIPTVEELEDLPDDLQEKYLKGNPARLASIQFLRSLYSLPTLYKNPEANQIMVGAGLFIGGLIGEEGLILSNEGGWFNTGSTLLQNLNFRIRNTADNRIPQAKQLMYLCKFYHFVEKQLSDNCLEGTAWSKDKEKLRADIIRILQKTLFVQQENVKTLEEARPTRERLRENLKDVYKRYKAVSPNGANMKQAQMVDLICDYCSKLDASCQTTASDAAPGAIDQAKRFAARTADDARYAISTFYMKEVEKSYENSSSWTAGLWGTSRSNFYGMLSGAGGINLKATNIYSADGLFTLMSTLNNCLTDILNNQPELLEAAEKGEFKDVRKELNALQAKLHTYMGELMVEQNAGLKGKLKDYIKGATKFTCNMVLKNLVAALIAGIVVASSGGVVGTLYAVFQGGQLIGTTAAAFCVTYGLPMFFATMLHDFIQSISNKTGDVGAEVAIVPVTVTKSLLSHCLSQDHPKATAEELRQNKEWLETLLLLPEEVFGEDRKNVITKTSNIERPTAEPLSLLRKV